MHADSAATFVKQNQPITGAVILSNKPTKSAFGADKDYIDFSTICIHLQTTQNRLTVNKDLNSSARYCVNNCLKCDAINLVKLHQELSGSVLG